MKRTGKIIKAAAFLLAIFMGFSFAACSAAPDADYNGEMFDGVNGGVSPGDPSYGLSDDEAMEEEVGDAEDKVPENQGTEEDSYEAADPDKAEVADLIKNAFTATAEQSFSTFSADVDTASYTYFRKLVNAGYDFNTLRNSGSNFRIEEFINYFRYDVAQPRDNELFGVKTELVPCPWNEDSLIFRVTLQAEAAKPSVGNNLVFLIDVSGSMSSQDKLPLLKRAFSYLVGNLDADDTVSIVTYSGREAVVLDGCNGLDTDKIMNTINSLSASGSTNGEAGLTMAYRLAEEHFIEGGNNRIIMASDGDLNVGISSKSELTKYIEEKRAQGVYLSVLGFGTGNYRDENMETLADNGNGVYYYIDGESEAEKVFGTDLSGTLYTVANDVKLQIEFDPDSVESYRLIGYDNRILDKEDFENDAKDAGEVGAAHQVTVCYEIKPIQTPGANDLLTLRVRYKNPGETLSLLNEYNVSCERNQPSQDMKFITAVIETAALLRNTEYTGDVTLEGILEDLNALTLDDPYKTEFRGIIGDLVSASAGMNAN